MAIGATVAGLIKKQQQERAAADDALRTAFRDRQALQSGHQLDQKGLAFDEKMKAEQAASAARASEQGQSAGTPTNSGLGKLGPEAVPGRLSELFSEFEDAGVASENTVQDADPRTETTTTTTDTERLGFGRGGEFLRGFEKFKDFGVTKGTRTSTRTGPSQAFAAKKADARTATGEAIFRVNQRDMKPNDFMSFLQPTLNQFNQAEQKEIMLGAQQDAQILGARQTSLDRKLGNELGLSTLQANPSLGAAGMEASHAVATARTSDEKREASDRYAGLILGSGEAVAARDRVASAEARAQAGEGRAVRAETRAITREQKDDHLRGINSKLADIRLEQAEFDATQQGPIRARAAAAVKTVGFFAENGLTSSRTEEQVLGDIKALRNDAGGINFTEEARGVIEQTQLNALQLGVLIPLASEGGFIEDPALRNMDFRLAQKFSAAFDGQMFDSNGRITTDKKKFSLETTRRVRKEGRAYMNGIGYNLSGQAHSNTAGDFDLLEQIRMEPDPNNPNKPILARAMELLISKDIYRAETGNVVDDIYDFQSERSAGDLTTPFAGQIFVPGGLPRPATPGAPSDPASQAGLRAGKSFVEFSRSALTAEFRKNQELGKAAARGLIPAGKAALGFGIGAGNELFGGPEEER